jgi:hypothetical protein
MLNFRFFFFRIHTLLICWEKLFNFLNSRGPLSRHRGPSGVRGPQVKNRCSSRYNPIIAVFSQTVITIRETELHLLIVGIHFRAEFGFELKFLVSVRLFMVSWTNGLKLQAEHVFT